MGLMFLFGCSTIPYYEDATVDQISVGDEIKVVLDGDEKASLTVSQVNADTIVGDDGETFSKIKIEEVRMRVPADQISCSSLASWRNTQCVLNSPF